MGISQTAVARDSSNNKAANIEYTIYTFQRCSDKAKAQERWQKQDTLADMGAAMTRAESLFDSGDFCKVEIKQKYMDHRNNRVVDTTLKVLERKAKKTLGAGLMTAMAAFGGLLAFGVTYFLTGSQP